MEKPEVVEGALFNTVYYNTWFDPNVKKVSRVKYFKTLKKANKHADKVAKMGTKFLEKKFSNKEVWQQVPLTSLPSNKRYHLSAEEVEELEKK